MSSDDVRRDYVWEKLYVALLSLSGSGSLEQRLEGAGLSLMRLRREEFIDDDEFTRWSGIMERLTALEGTVAEGGIGATAKAMNRNQAKAVINEILDLYERHVVALIRRDLTAD